MNGEPSYYQRLAWRVAQSLPERTGGRAVLVTSARRGEGKSYVAAALASALSEQTSRPVALCACLPAPHLMPPRDPVAAGAGNQLVAAGAMDLAPFIASGAGGQVVHVPFGRGDISTLFQVSNVRQGLDLLRLHFNLVILDGPVLADCDALAACTDGTLLVVDSETTRREIVTGSLRSHPHIRQKMLGAVLNKLPRYIPRWLYRRAL